MLNYLLKLLAVTKTRTVLSWWTQTVSHKHETTPQPDRKKGFALLTQFCWCFKIYSATKASIIFLTRSDHTLDWTTLREEVVGRIGVMIDSLSSCCTTTTIVIIIISHSSFTTTAHLDVPLQQILKKTKKFQCLLPSLQPSVTRPLSPDHSH